VGRAGGNGLERQGRLEPRQAILSAFVAGVLQSHAVIHLSDLLAATGGAVSGPVGPIVFDSFGFDSRIIRPGQLFVAVVTERADGHAYALDAVRAGAGGVLSHKPFDLNEWGATCVVVPDTRLAMQEWARLIVRKQGLTVIGITGSVGKTTTKEAIAAVLGDDATLGDAERVFRNRANFNGLFGLPIALSEIRPEQRVAVLEMAADHFGEIRRLTEIARPQIAVVTTVEPAHLETFGSLDAIAREKSELVAALPADGLAILNADDPRVAAMAARAPDRVLTYGTADATAGRRCPEICASGILPARDGVSFTVDTPSGRRRMLIPLLGRHQVYAALAALAVGIAQGRELDEIAARLAALERVPGRLNPLPGARGSLILDDSYSSSPAAAEAALETLAALEGRRRVAVLGDMLELGAFEATGHEQVGRKAAAVVDLLVTRGNRARRIGEAAREAGLPEDRVVVTYTAEDAARAALADLGPGDIALVKGSLATRMEQVVRLLMAEPLAAERSLVRQDAAWQAAVTLFPDRPTWLEIDHGAIAHNVRRLVELAGGRQLLISLKADAYGHGAIQVAQTALLNGASWCGVATLSEGVALRDAGIRAPVLILGFTPAWQARDALRRDLRPTVYNIEVGRALSRAALALDKPARAHVKIDTGMGRLGIFPEEAVAFIREVAALPGVTVEGIFTHLSVADGDSEWEREYTAEQLRRFDVVLAELEREGIEIPLVHGVNSAGLLDATVGFLGESRALARHTLVRAGIAVYGLHPSPGVSLPPDFRPALAWKTQIAQVKTLPEGSFVSYGATYRTAGRRAIAVIPVGYADGFRRAPQNWGEVLVRGVRAPIVGRVTMDQTMVDVTGIPGAQQGDEVVLIGRQGADAISAEEVAARLGTINYEVVSAILARVPRETPA
jgi:Alr-MurF fusion protein